MKVFKAIAAGVLAVGLLAGTGHVTSNVDTSSDRSKSNSTDRLNAYLVPTPKGEEVTCVVYNDGFSAGGVSCDWEGAK